MSPVVTYYMLQIHRYVTNGKAYAQIMPLLAAPVKPDDENNMSHITRPSVLPSSHPKENENNMPSMPQNDADRSPNKQQHRLPTTLQQSYDKMEFRKRQSSQQAYWYIGVYLFTHVFSLFVGISDQAGFPSQFWLQFLANFFWPIQGFGNLCVFLKPRLAAMKRQYPAISTIYIIFCSLFYFDDRTQ